MNKYFNVSLNKSYKSDMNNYNYNFDVVSTLPPAATYFPLTNTGVNPVYGNNGNDNQTINGQTYTFVPNDGLYFDSPPNHFGSLFNGSIINDPDIGLWNVSNVTIMYGMFQNTTFNQDLSGWDVSNVTNMLTMFNSTPFNQDIGSWNTSNVTIMSEMFRDSPFNQDISGWDVSNVTQMDSMFRNTPFNQDLSGWDVSNVIYMDRMFDSAISFNQDIGGWNTSNVINMFGMFWNASNFNQDLSGWCVTNITTEPNYFSDGSALIPANKPVWGTCP